MTDGRRRTYSKNTPEWKFKNILLDGMPSYGIAGGNKRCERSLKKARQMTDFKITDFDCEK
jgi:hypothetical protein